MSSDKRALLIGVSAFDAARTLPKAVHDVNRLASVLRSPDGASFASVQELTGEAGRLRVDLMRTAIETFLRDAPAQSLLFLYLATHAIVANDGSLALLASDYVPKLPHSTQLPISFIGDCLSACRSSAVVIVVDTCFADTGAWNLFSQRKLPFAVNRDLAPEFCVIAATRSNDAAVDGAFAPLFAEALRIVDPRSDELAVSAGRLFNEVADPLKDRFAQFARKWESASRDIPLGRAHRGSHVSATLIAELYTAVRGKTLIRANRDPFDFIEVGRGRFDQEERVGIKIHPNGTRADAEGLVLDIAKSVGTLAVQEAIIIANSAEAFANLPLARTTVLEFPELRRRVHPLSKYLEKSIERYEKTSIFRFDHYVSLRARQENDPERFILDRHIEDWITRTDDVAELIVLGDFGTGKTTTARRIFWRQARRHLERPHVERVPIFINLRQYSDIQQIEGLIQRTIHELGAIGAVSVEDILEMNEAGQILWILDGFDEMAARVTPDLVKRNYSEIQRLLRPASRLLLTCRTHFFGSREEVENTFRFVGTELLEQSRKASFRLVFPEPLDAEQIAQFVYARMRDPELTQRDKSLTPAEVLAKISESDELNDLATRPLLTEMVVVSLPSIVEKQLPLNYASLYSVYTEDLLERDNWRLAIMDPALRHRFPHELAWHLFTSGDAELSYRDFPRYVKAFFKAAERTHADVEQLIIAAQTIPLLTRDESGNYAFAHKSFLEFFAAAHIVEHLKNGDTQILEVAVLPREILRFLAETLEAEPEAMATFRQAVEANRFSLRSFFIRYLRPRMFPALTRDRARHPVQRRHDHLLVHLVFPAVIGLISTFLFAVHRKALSPAEMAPVCFEGFGTVVLALMLGHLMRYGYLVLRGRAAHPTLRFNVAATLFVLAKPPSAAADFDKRVATIERLIADVDDHQRPVAEQTWDAILRKATNAALPRRTPLRLQRARLGGPPVPLIVAGFVVMILASIAATTSTFLIDHLLLLIASLYGFVVARHCVRPLALKGTWLRNLATSFKTIARDGVVLLAVVTVLYAIAGSRWIVRNLDELSGVSVSIGGEDNHELSVSGRKQLKTEREELAERARSRPEFPKATQEHLALYDTALVNLRRTQEVYREFKEKARSKEDFRQLEMYRYEWIKALSHLRSLTAPPEWFRDKEEWEAPLSTFTHFLLTDTVLRHEVADQIARIDTELRRPDLGPVDTLYLRAARDALARIHATPEAWQLNYLRMETVGQPYREALRAYAYPCLLLAVVLVHFLLLRAFMRLPWSPSVGWLRLSLTYMAAMLVVTCLSVLLPFRSAATPAVLLITSHGAFILVSAMIAGPRRRQTPSEGSSSDVPANLTEAPGLGGLAAK